MSASDRPVVFFAFANDRTDEASYLRNLPKEARQLRAAMSVAEKADLCEIAERHNVTIDDLFAVFQDTRYRDRVAVLHYAGHAGDAGLFFETPTGAPELAHAPGIADLLRLQCGLELVFLNGCSTAGQVQGLLEAGAHLVIATSQDIQDEVAAELSACFYEGIASGASLKRAFQEAEAKVRTRLGTPERAYRHVAPPVDTDHWPWELHVAPGAERRADTWSLASAAGDPLFGLPSLPVTDLPPSPFKHLHWFTQDDAPVFFGRGREIRDLYDAVTAPEGAPIILLFGATGVGKSSLLAAGLVPRLAATHEVLYLRRDGALGIAGTLTLALAPSSHGPEGPGPDRAETWQAREMAEERPLVVILDQAEEPWTRPLASGREAGELQELLQAIFGLPATRPRGRLILSFRKEWLAEVLGLLDDAALPFARVEVRHLGWPRSWRPSPGLRSAIVSSSTIAWRSSRSCPISLPATSWRTRAPP